MLFVSNILSAIFFSLNVVVYYFCLAYISTRFVPVKPDRVVFIVSELPGGFYLHSAAWITGSCYLTVNEWGWVSYEELWRSRRVLAEADNTLRDLHNSSYDTKTEFNNCFIIHSK